MVWEDVKDIRTHISNPNPDIIDTKYGIFKNRFN